MCLTNRGDGKRVCKFKRQKKEREKDKKGGERNRNDS